MTRDGDVHHASLLAQPASDVGGGFLVILDEEYLHTRLHRPAGSIGFRAGLILRGGDRLQRPTDVRSSFLSWRQWRRNAYFA